MFPNVRLMVVAVLAAIAGIGCGLGLFATFRVNHEPLARFAEGNPPLQLAFDNLASGSDARTPLEARLPVGSAAKLVSVPVSVPSPAVEQAETNPANAADSASVQQPAAGAGEQNNAASLAVVVADQSSAPADGAVVPSQQDPATVPHDQEPAVAAASTNDQTSDIGATAKDQEPAANPTTAVKSKAAKPFRATAQARRATRTVRARRTVSVAAQPAYQYSQLVYSQPTYSQPTYTWADGTSQASRPVKRVQIKRHRAAKKALATQSNPLPATAGLNGIQ